MKHILIILTFFGLTIFGTQGQTKDLIDRQYSDVSDINPADTLYRIYKGDRYELGIPCGYVNQKLDTVIPIGKYFHCYLDTVYTYAIVTDTNSSEIYAIDQNENRLYDIYWFDNGPDYIKEGLFRIKRNNKIGYANTEGQIIIQPQFDCANQFENGKAKVTYDCELKKVGEYNEMYSDNWFYIDKSGQRIK